MQPHPALTVRHCMWGNFWQRFLKFAIMAHCNLSLKMFEGKSLMIILKIWVEKTLMIECCQNI